MNNCFTSQTAENSFIKLQVKLKRFKKKVCLYCTGEELEMTAGVKKGCVTVEWKNEKKWNRINCQTKQKIINTLFETFCLTAYFLEIQNQFFLQIWNKSVLFCILFLRRNGVHHNCAACHVFCYTNYSGAQHS